MPHSIMFSFLSCHLFCFVVITIYGHRSYKQENIDYVLNQFYFVLKKVTTK